MGWNEIIPRKFSYLAFSLKCSLYMEKPPSPQRQIWDAYSLGIQLVLMLVLCGGIGWQLDTWYPWTHPWALIGGIVFGMLAMIWHGYREMDRIK